MEVDVLKMKELLSSKRGSNLLSYLNKQSKFVEAMNSEVGRQILYDAVARMDYLLNTIVNETARDVDKAEFRVLKGIIERWSERINSYNEQFKKVSKGE